MNLLQEWVSHALKLAETPADFYSGCRKILRNRIITFHHWDDSLQIEDSGYTKSKMTMLRKNYLHEESIAMAVRLWDRRREQAKYGSVSFTTFNHFVKGKGTLDEIVSKGSKRASVFGPCLQSVCITWLDKKNVGVEVMYRTTEFFKKFPADLVFIRDELLSRFNFKGMNLTVSFHFANITAHPMYGVTIIPHMDDPVASFEKLKKRDKFFWAWAIKWSARYICPEHMRGIQKFAQAMRVHKDANERIDSKTLKLLQKYFRDNHPGHRSAYIDPDEDEE
jgi:hypothetical protein